MNRRSPVPLEKFDRLIRKRHYTNRSEGIRDLSRQEFVKQEWEENQEVAGIATFAFDRRRRSLVGRIVDIPHDVVFGLFLVLTYYEHMLITLTVEDVMSRPKCCRRVDAIPCKSCFKPEGSPASPFPGEVLLSLDEYESLRLADLEGLYQEQAASKMNISRQTFGRIVESAHRKVADVLVNGKTLRIEGGPVSVKAGETVQCPHCHHSHGFTHSKDGALCPHCRKRQ